MNMPEAERVPVDQTCDEDGYPWDCDLGGDLGNDSEDEEEDD